MVPNATLQLPLQVTSPVDVGRLQRELDSIDAVMDQALLRKDDLVKLPKMTGLMDQTVQLNKIDLTQPDQRKNLAKFLAVTKTKAPLLHISFSADPSTSFIDLLLTWLRKELHPNLLVTIGLQPNIGAGCIVRSMNKYFDFSLRQDFANKRGLLLERLGPLLAEPTPVAVAGVDLPAATLQPDVHVAPALATDNAVVNQLQESAA